MIGTITVCLLLTVTLSRISIKYTVLYIVFIFISYSIMTFIYIRKVTFTKKSIILFVMAILLSYGVIKTSDVTDGFGLKYSYRNKTKVSSIIFNAGIDFFEDDYKGYYIEVEKYAKTDELKDYLEELQNSLVDKDQDTDICNECIYHLYTYLSVNYEGSPFRYHYSYNRSSDEAFETMQLLDIADHLYELGVKFTCYDYEGNGMNYPAWKLAITSRIED